VRFGLVTGRAGGALGRHSLQCFARLNQETAMAKQWSMRAYFAFHLSDKPGALARFSDRLHEAGISLAGLWGYSGEGGKARFCCVPNDENKFRRFAKSARLKAEEGRTFYRSGADRPGALVNALDDVARAGINLHGIEVIAAGGKFGCFLWADADDWDELEARLG
jgi:prephenate dehydratase